MSQAKLLFSEQNLCSVTSSSRNRITVSQEMIVEKMISGVYENHVSKKRKDRSENNELYSEDDDRACDRTLEFSGQTPVKMCQ